MPEEVGPKELSDVKFDVEGIKMLKLEIQILQELVTAMASVLTENQKVAVRSAQRANVETQDRFEARVREGAVEINSHYAIERALRIKRTLA